MVVVYTKLIYEWGKALGIVSSELCVQNFKTQISKSIKIIIFKNLNFKIYKNYNLFKY